ncbi:hypothetical protein JVU11DRAFT_10893 [Chiua virens]|nr:hypothetical protein JVU11DRAFT_10893 [Chiua virens]
MPFSDDHSSKHTADHSLSETNGDLTPGQLPDHVYNATLPPWRAAIHTHLVKTIAQESVLIACLQTLLCHPWLDKYFLYSMLGTHFFMIALSPVLFFFGYPEVGRGLVVVLASGVYFSFIKDLVCSPRPFAPPVTRLSV